MVASVISGGKKQRKKELEIKPCPNYNNFDIFVNLGKYNP